MSHESIADRLERYSIPEPNSGCILWTGAVLHGYGAVRVGKITARAHRVAYELARGPIPDGLVIDHLCKVKCCINPYHLEAVPQMVNVRRATGVTDTHCANGHEFTRENTTLANRRRRFPSRVCRTCRRNGRAA